MTTARSIPDNIPTDAVPKSIGVDTKNRALKMVSSTFYKLGPDAGEVSHIEGTLLEKETQTFTRGKVSSDVGRYKVQTDMEEVVSFLGSVSIDDLLRQVEPGTYISLTYLKTIKTQSNMDMKQFSLYVA